MRKLNFDFKIHSNFENNLIDDNNPEFNVPMHVKHLGDFATKLSKKRSNKYSLHEN